MRTLLASQSGKDDVMGAVELPSVNKLGLVLGRFFAGYLVVTLGSGLEDFGSLLEDISKNLKTSAEILSNRN